MFRESNSETVVPSKRKKSISKVQYLITRESIEKTIYWCFWIVKGKEKLCSTTDPLHKDATENIGDVSDDDDMEVRGRGRPKLSQKEKERRAREALQTKKPRGRPRKPRETPTPVRMGGINKFFANLGDK